MIVADTSALISLAAADVLELTLDEFDVHTTETVVRELRETAEYDDPHGRAAERVLERETQFRAHDTGSATAQSSRIDEGEASCLAAVREQQADFLLTDDLRALPELQTLVDTEVAISPILLRALVKRGALTDERAREHLDRLAETRGWLGAPIYRRAQELFDEG